MEQREGCIRKLWHLVAPPAAVNVAARHAMRKKARRRHKWQAGRCGDGRATSLLPLPAGGTTGASGSSRGSLGAQHILRAHPGLKLLQGKQTKHDGRLMSSERVRCQALGRAHSGGCSGHHLCGMLPLLRVMAWHLNQTAPTSAHLLGAVAQRQRRLLQGGALQQRGGEEARIGQGNSGCAAAGRSCNEVPTEAVAEHPLWNAVNQTAERTAAPPCALSWRWRRPCRTQSCCSARSPTHEGKRPHQYKGDENPQPNMKRRRGRRRRPRLGPAAMYG